MDIDRGIIMDIDRKTLPGIRDLILKTLEPLQKTHGLSFEFEGGASFTSDNARFKMVMNKCHDGKVVEPVMVRDFKMSAETVGLLKTDLGKIFNHQYNRYRILGLKSRNHKYPIIAKSLRNGKDYKFSVKTIKMSLGR